MGRRSDIDWNAVEVDFRVGLVPVRAIARKFQISDSNLRARARREGWTRADGEAARVAVRTAAAAATRQQAQEIGAAIGAEQAQQMRQSAIDVVLSATEVHLEHRRASRRAVAVAMGLLAELEVAANAGELLAAEVAQCQADDPGRAAVVDKLLGLRGRVETLDRWASAFARLTSAERESIDADGEGKQSTLDELLIKIAKEREQRGGTDRPQHYSVNRDQHVSH